MAQCPNTLIVSAKRLPRIECTDNVGVSLREKQRSFSAKRGSARKMVQLEEKISNLNALIVSAKRLPRIERTDDVGVSLSEKPLVRLKGENSNPDALIVSTKRLPLTDSTNDVGVSLREKPLVRVERLELPRLAAPEPKSGVSTNFTIPA